MSEAIPVNVSTARDALAGLPLTVRLTLLFVARLRREAERVGKLGSVTHASD